MWIENFLVIKIVFTTVILSSESLFLMVNLFIFNDIFSNDLKWDQQSKCLYYFIFSFYTLYIKNEFRPVKVNGTTSATVKVP